MLDLLLPAQLMLDYTACKIKPVEIQVMSVLYP